MSTQLKRKQKVVQRRRFRIRNRVSGTADKPRLSVHFSNKHICAQVIDDREGKTLCAMSTQSKDLASEKLKANVEGATALGKLIGEKAKAAGINTLVFDRNGRRYHGAVKALAESVREAGIQF